MSIELWETLPPSFLRMSYKRWAKLDYGVKQLVVELAKSQRFKCALCSETQRLEIEHDHDPEEGPGHSYTTYNIRGLACRSCNWHLRYYEAEQNGEPFGLENTECRISDGDYVDYIYFYRCRVRPLNDALQEQRIGVRNPWHRRRVLQEFDEWRSGEKRSHWREQWEERHKWDNLTPIEFIEVLTAIIQGVKEQLDKDPNYRPPESFWNLVVRVRSLVEEVKAMSGQIGAENAAAQLSQANPA
jgi:hypothetical protein